MVYTRAHGRKNNNSNSIITIRELMPFPSIPLSISAVGAHPIPPRRQGGGGGQKTRKRQKTTLATRGGGHSNNNSSGNTDRTKTRVCVRRRGEDGEEKGVNMGLQETSGGDGGWKRGCCWWWWRGDILQ